MHNKCRSKNKIHPDENATGAHTVFKRNQSGEITNYKTYTPNPKNPSGFDFVLGYDKYGKHGDINGPHIHLPGGKYRKPYLHEIPKT